MFYLSKQWIIFSLYSCTKALVASDNAITIFFTLLGQWNTPHGQAFVRMITTVTWNEKTATSWHQHGSQHKMTGDVLPDFTKHRRTSEIITFSSGGFPLSCSETQLSTGLGTPPTPAKKFATYWLPFALKAVSWARLNTTAPSFSYLATWPRFRGFSIFSSSAPPSSCVGCDFCLEWKPWNTIGCNRSTVGGSSGLRFASSFINLGPKSSSWVEGQTVVELHHLWCFCLLLWVQKQSPELGDSWAWSHQAVIFTSTAKKRPWTAIEGQPHHREQCHLQSCQRVPLGSFSVPWQPCWGWGRITEAVILSPRWAGWPWRTRRLTTLSGYHPIDWELQVDQVLILLNIVLGLLSNGLLLQKGQTYSLFDSIFSCFLKRPRLFFGNWRALAFFFRDSLLDSKSELSVPAANTVVFGRHFPG